MEKRFPLSGDPIVVIGPMACEIEDIAVALAQPTERREAGYGFTEGTLDGYPVVAVRSLIGMVNVAVATTLAIVRYRPAAVIIQGTAGGHSPALHKKDILLGERMVELANFYMPHRDGGAGSAYQDWWAAGEEIETGEGVARFKELFGDPALLAIAEETPYTEGRLVRGTIGSSDIWNRELDRIAFYHETMGTDAEEMEGFAVAQVCRAFGVPMLDIRILSNSELHPEEDFSEDTGAVCQAYVLRVLRRMIGQ